MCCGRFPISPAYRKAVACQLQRDQHLGNVRQVTYLLASLAVLDGQNFAPVALILRVHAQTVAAWVRVFCCDGLKGTPRKKPTGRPPTLTPTQQAARATLRDEGPVNAGFSGACWRSPMIPQMSFERCGVSDQVFYLAQVLKNFGFSSQQAALVSDHLDERQRHEWRTTTWPQILRGAQGQHALRLCGDAASFPQGGTRTYTWARRGQQPVVKTSGQRKGYKVFGLIDDFTGRFWYQGQEGRRTSAASMAFLTRVLEHTPQPIVRMQDGAKYHPSPETKAFFAQHTARRQVVQLPTSSPDDTPIETLWKQIKQQETPLHDFPSFETLTEQVEQALLTCAHTPGEVLALCGLPTALAQAA